MSESISSSIYIYIWSKTSSSCNVNFMKQMESKTRIKCIIFKCQGCKIYPKSHGHDSTGDAVCKILHLQLLGHM